MEKSAILVLGMHRSGTSALTRIINLMGATSPRTLMEAAPDNARGFWESTVLMERNDELLAACGSSWSSWKPLKGDLVQVARSRGLDVRLREAIESEFGGAGMIVLKDPRVSRLVPLYEEVLSGLGYRVLPVIALRNPVEVAASLVKRGDMGPRSADLLWLRYTLDAERATRGRPRAVISYDALMENWRSAMAIVGRHLGISWPAMTAEAQAEADGFISSSLRHHALAPPRGSGLGRKRLVPFVYDAMGRLTRDPADRRALLELSGAGAWLRLL